MYNSDYELQKKGCSTISYYELYPPSHIMSCVAKKTHIACFQVALVVLQRLFNILCTCANILNPDKCWSTYISESDLYYNSDFQLATVQLRLSLVLQLRFSVGRSTTQILTCTTAQIFSYSSDFQLVTVQSTLIGPGFANAHGHPQIFAVPWMPWKSTLSKPIPF